MFYDPVEFSARQVLLAYRHEVVELPVEAVQVDPKVVNKVSTDYDDPQFASVRQDLLDQRVLLGPVWVSSEQLGERVTAFVGITLRGTHNVKPAEILRMLRSEQGLRNTLVHLFQTDRGQPFHYFAKLACRDMQELDEATNAIGSARIGPVRLEGKTLVVAKGVDHMPLYRSRSHAAVGLIPDVSDIHMVAERLVSPFGAAAVNGFNALESATKLAFLASLRELRAEVDAIRLDEEYRGRVVNAIEKFAGVVLSGAKPIDMTGAVMELASVVEASAKRALRLAAERAYGREHARAQRELKLPTKDFRKVSLGKAAHAFRVMSSHKDFEFIASELERDALDRLELFSEERNRWAHGSMIDLGEVSAIDAARRTLLHGIASIRWLLGDVTTAVSEGAITQEAATDSLTIKARTQREFGIFVSYSAQDKPVADHIVDGLRALRLPFWYAPVEIGPGDSIVQQVSGALARHDTVLILLSPNSVKSKWVQQELNSALMAKLRGEKVRIVPLLIAQCQIPEVLKDVRYIDLASDFHDGFMELLSFLGGLRRRDYGPGDNKQQAE